MSLAKMLSRALISLVTLVNLQCAFAFVIFPHAYLHSFNLEGDVGAAVIRGTGLLFIMWNIPYIFSLVNPVKHRTSLIQAIIMQAIGFVGESSILILTPALPAQISSSITRFIVFDGVGLGLLLIAFFLVRNIPKRTEE